MNTKEKWWKAMIATHGSEEAVRQFMGAANMKRKTIGGGFRVLQKTNPDKLKEISRMGGKASKRDGSSNNT